MTHKLETYIVQTWHRDTLISQIGGTEEIPGLSYDAAKEIAKAHGDMPYLVGRIMSQDSDYVEVYDINGTRTGTFAETTLVHTPKA